MPFSDRERNREYQREWARKNAQRRNLRKKEHRKLIAQIKQERGCSRCGYSKCSAALHFHHREETEKHLGISKLLAYKWELLKIEIEKCDVLCANCHAEIHSRA